jgi:hypothetical protein
MCDPTWFRRLLPIILLLPFVHGCGGDVAGENRGGGIPQWRFEEEIRIGGAESELDLREAAHVVADSTGLYIVDPIAHLVTRISLDGRVDHFLGRPGDGPGELAQAFALQVVGDTVWVQDGMVGLRMEAFYRGRAAESIRPPMHTTNNVLIPWAMAVDGTMIVRNRVVRVEDILALDLYHSATP